MIWHDNPFMDGRKKHEPMTANPTQVLHQAHFSSSGCVCVMSQLA